MSYAIHFWKVFMISLQEGKMADLKDTEDPLNYRPVFLRSIVKLRKSYYRKVDKILGE